VPAIQGALSEMQTLSLPFLLQAAYCHLPEWPLDIAINGTRFKGNFEPLTKQICTQRAIQPTVATYLD